jgi:hypothetical protein
MPTKPSCASSGPSSTCALGLHSFYFLVCFCAFLFSLNRRTLVKRECGIISFFEKNVPCCVPNVGKRPPWSTRFPEAWEAHPLPSGMCPLVTLLSNVHMCFLLLFVTLSYFELLPLLCAICGMILDLKCVFEERDGQQTFELINSFLLADNDRGDADEKIDMVDGRHDANSIACEDNSMSMTTSAAYPTSDVFRDASMTRFSTDTAVTVHDILRNTESSHEDEFIGSQTTFDVTESCIIWPLVDENAATDHRHETISVEEALLNSDGACLFFAIQQTKSLEYGDKDANDSGIPDEVDDFDPYLFIKSLPDLSEVVSPYRPGLLPRQTRRRQPVTLVLDLDGKKDN